jgi:hypothetical protein
MMMTLYKNTNLREDTLQITNIYHKYFWKTNMLHFIGNGTIFEDEKKNRINGSITLTKEEEEEELSRIR